MNALSPLSDDGAVVIGDLEALGRDMALQRLDLLAGAMSAGPPQILGSGDPRAALDAAHFQRRPMPPAGFHAVPGQVLGGIGVLRGADGRPFRHPGCIAGPLRRALDGPADPALWGVLGGGAAEVLQSDTPCLVPFQPAAGYAEFLTDALPRLYLLGLLRRLGRWFPVAMSRAVPEWQRRLLQLYVPEGEVLWFDPAREVVQAPACILPSLLAQDGFLHPAVGLAAEDLLARTAAAPPAVADQRLYVTYHGAPAGPAGGLANEPELAAVLATHGFRTIQPWRMSFAEQLAAYRTAACIVAEPGPAAANALFAPLGARIATLGMPDALLRRICGLRGQLLGIVERQDGPGGRIDPEVLARFLPRLLETPAERTPAARIVRAAMPVPAPAMPPPSPSPPAPPQSAADGQEFIPQGPFLLFLADTAGQRFEQFAPGEVHERRPFFFDMPLNPTLAQYAGRFTDAAYRTYAAPRTGCAALPGASAIGATGLICHDGRLIRDSTHSVDDWRPTSLVARRDMERGVWFKRPVHLPGRRIAGGAFCGFSGGWRNHAHWLSETLPRLHLYRWLCEREPPMPLLLPDFGDSAVHRRTLELLGIDPAQTIRLAEDEVISADILWNVPVIDLWSLPRLCRIAADALAAAVAEDAAAALAPRVYIHRRDGLRRLANFDAIAPILAAEGFHVAVMEDLTLDQQVQLMRHARFVIGEHGAGVANTMFCRPGARVLELFNPVCPQPAHWVLASLCGLQYGYAVGRHAPTEHRPDPDWNADYLIPPEDFQRALRAMLAGG